MKIVIDARLYGIEHAGPGRYVKNLVDNLLILDKKNDYLILLREKYFNKLNLPNNFEEELAEYPHYTIKEQLLLPIALYKHKPDVVHFPFFNVPIFYFGKFVVTIHDLTMHKFTGGEATTRGLVKYKIWRLGYYIAFTKAVHSSRKIITPSKFVKNEISSYYNINKDKITVTYEGVDDAIKLLEDNKKVLEKYKIEYPYFIYSGSAYPHKNLETVIKAIKLLNKKRSKKILFVITSSRTVFTKRILESAKKIRASEYVKHVGFVPDSDLASLYHNSLAYVYPTLSEGFGLPGLEAMSVKTLVVASDIKVLREVYGDNAIYFDPKSILSLVKVMNKVIDLHITKREEHIKSNCEYVKKYSWNKMADKTMDVYLHCIK